MSGKIFINYRRDDEPGYSLALFQRLESEFGRSRLFMDVEGYIRAGDDFVNILRSKVAECDVLLAIIGPRWLSATDAQGRQRLHLTDDFVRIEIAVALELGKRVIPVLINKTQLPQYQSLPNELHPLCRRQGVNLLHERWATDCAKLIQQIRTEFKENTKYEEEDEAWAEVESSKTGSDEWSALDRYLSNWWDGRYALEARMRLVEVKARLNDTGDYRASDYDY